MKRCGKFRKLVTLLTFYVVLSASAQSPLLNELKLIFNGKSMPVTSVLLDKEGLLWFGNQLGVFIYNGYQINQLYNANRLSKEVTAFFEDSSGVIWAGTKGGDILKFINYHQVGFLSNNLMPVSAVTSITQDVAGNIWFATDGQGVYVFANNKLSNINFAGGLSSNNVNCILSSYKGNVLCGTDHGIVYMNYKNGKIYIVKKLDKTSGIPNDSITALTYLEKNILVIGTKDAGAFVYNETKNKNDILLQQGTSVSTFAVIGNEVWVGTTDNGIFDCEFLQQPTIRNLNLSEDYGILKIQKIINSPYYYQIVLAENKLYITQGEWFEKINLPDDQLNPKPRAIEVGAGYIYAVYNHGLFKRSLNNEKEWLPVYTGQKIDYQYVSSMLMDQYGYLWISSLKDGIYCLDARQNVVDHFTKSSGLIDNSILKLKRIKNFLYYGSNKGIGFVRLNNDNSPVRFASQFKQLENIIINDISFSKDTLALWLGTGGRGIVKLTENTCKFYLDNVQDDKKIVNSMACDKEGMIWYTSLDYGLNKLNNTVGESVNYLKKINYSAINALFIDGKNNVVTIHDDFISIFNPYSKQQYSQIGDFGFTSIDYSNSMVAYANGAYYIMSKDGVYIYQPARFAFMQNLTAFIHSINVNLQKVKTSDKGELTLSYDENHLDFQLFTPWYGNHDKIKYEYVLTGMSSDTVLTSDNKIYFPNLPSGRYTLKVRPVILGSIIDTRWSEKSFVISKPWYKTIWFILFFTLSGFVILYFINYNFLKNQNRSNEIERQRLRQEIKILNNQINPHFLFNSLNNLISIIDIDTANAKIYTAHLADFYRLIVAYKDNYVITLEEDLRISRIFIALQNIRFSDAIVYKVRVPESYLKCYLPPLTLQILVENAIKHNKVSQSQPLNIDISMEKDFLVVKNKISRKENLETSTKSGIKFIVDRFDFITKAKPVIEQTEAEFIVKVPLIYNEPLPA